jgi:hypothetical protein
MERFCGILNPMARSTSQLNTSLANRTRLVNLRGTEDGWFEMDRLNECFNLQISEPCSCPAARKLSNSRK